MAEQSTAVQRAREAAPLRITPIDDIFDHVNEMYNAIARQAFEFFDGRGRQEGHDLDDWIRAYESDASSEDPCRTEGCVKGAKRSGGDHRFDRTAVNIISKLILTSPSIS